MMSYRRMTTKKKPAPKAREVVIPRVEFSNI